MHLYNIRLVKLLFPVVIFGDTEGFKGFEKCPYTKMLKIIRIIIVKLNLS